MSPAPFSLPAASGAELRWRGTWPCWADTLHSSPKGGKERVTRKRGGWGPRGSSLLPLTSTDPSPLRTAGALFMQLFLHSFTHSFIHTEHLLHRLATGQAAVVRQWPCLPSLMGRKGRMSDKSSKPAALEETDTGPRQEDMEAKSWTAR